MSRVEFEYNFSTLEYVSILTDALSCDRKDIPFSVARLCHSKENAEKILYAIKSIKALIEKADNFIPAQLGDRESAVKYLNQLADRSERQELLNDDFALIASILRRVAADEKPIQYLAGTKLTSRGKRSFKNARAIYSEVEKLHKDGGIPLIGNSDTAGAFELVADVMPGFTETTVKRHYYDFKRVLSVMDINSLEKSEMTKRIMYSVMLSDVDLTDEAARNRLILEIASKEVSE